MKEKSFGKWRSSLWPVHSFELKKVLPLIIMKFLISFIYGIMFSMKDTLIVTGEGSGAEVIPVLKGWIVLPAAVGVSLLYSKLANRYQRSTLFYGTIFSFLSFILLFSFVLYPNKDFLTPLEHSNNILNSIGQNYSHWVAIYRNWIFTLFFVVAELWAPLVIFILFWGFCNQINLIEEAKRYYTLFIVAGDLGTLFTGPLIVYYSKKFSTANYIFTIQSLATCVTAFCLIIAFLHWWLVRYGLQNQDMKIDKITLKKKPKLTLVEGLKYIASSKYLRCIAVMVVGYGLAINVIEVTWKANALILYPNSGDYQAFVGKVTTLIGLISLLTAFFLSGNMIRKIGWRFSAKIPPITLGITGSIFFALLMLKNSFAWDFFGAQTLLVIVFFGAFQNIMSKTVKYSFFDPTKEMAFIPLDEESKVKGKAAIDVVGSRLGKSGSAWIQLLLMQLAGTGSVLAITGFLLPVLVMTTIYWVFSVNTLDKEFSRKSEEKATEEAVAASGV